MAEPIEAFKNAFKIPELKSRIIFTLLMLTIYRLGSHVPVPGVDGGALASMLGRGTGLLGFYDMFTGGAFTRATVFALGIMPYITASIILSLLVNVIPALENLQKQGQEGQRKINDYTRYGTIGLCIVQSAGMAFYLQGLGTEIVPNPGVFFMLLTVVTMTAGTAFITKVFGPKGSISRPMPAKASSRGSMAAALLCVNSTVSGTSRPCAAAGAFCRRFFKASKRIRSWAACWSTSTA